MNPERWMDLVRQLPAIEVVENPYPEYIVDECPGSKVRNELHIAWQQGYEAGMAARRRRRPRRAFPPLRRAVAELEGEWKPGDG